MSTPTTDAPVVTPDDVAAELGGVRLDGAARRIIGTAIARATHAVEAYLGRPVGVRSFTETRRLPVYDGRVGWDIDGDRAIDLVAVTGAAAENDTDGNPTGYYTVTYRAGLDVTGDASLAPIRDAIITAAADAPGVVRWWQDTNPTAARRLKSASAEGQSVSYDYVTPSGGSAVRQSTTPPGQFPALDRWRLAGRRAYQRPGEPVVPWGYGAGDYAETWRW